ncbi:uroporphyrinogen decarboxylase family protein [uncultured Draconibacterium sp.]|uniref:uroporphyrinogen decarboxylase family protein n=1 Tax=uncultured Draconibacterium sp. TaxID=1573823 RepID=UPI0025D3EABC|nr:uroporphyrinogen decarboxylase family protein [uncultured Draconibacterium sp.]
MFNYTGKSTSLDRSENAQKKVKRLQMAAGHQEPDRIPIGEFFWNSFINRWRIELGLPKDANPYYHYDLDWIVVNPNMDPHIKNFKVLFNNEEEVQVETGYEVEMRKRHDFPMPEMIKWKVDTIEKLLDFTFDNPYDKRRYFAAGDDHINGVGDTFEQNIPAWIDRVKSFYPDFAVFGGVGEINECLTRLIGQENAMLWSMMHYDSFPNAIAKIGQFYFDICKAQVEAADGLLDGMVIWGDVAYKNGLFFDPEYWREHFKPWVKKMVDYCHEKGLMVIYHGCGNVNAIFGDYIELGVDFYNPLEAKANMDVNCLREKYGHAIGFCGNNNVMDWETGDKNQIKADVLKKLQAARGGSFIFQSDHSVTSQVSGSTYDFIIKLVREHGNYPLKL